MICYFRKGQKPSVSAEIKERGRDLDSYEEIIEKAVDVQAKVVLRPCFSIRKTNQYCLRGSWLATTNPST